jgi:hypothetical protein
MPVVCQVTFRIRAIKFRCIWVIEEQNRASAAWRSSALRAALQQFDEKCMCRENEKLSNNQQCRLNWGE